MQPLRAGDSVVLLGCSNGRPTTSKAKDELRALVTFLEQFQLNVIVTETVFVNESTQETLPASIRATTLLNYLLDDKVRAIFDLTGGDLANETLLALQPHIDKIHQLPCDKYYVGYSDNTVLLNALMPYLQIYPVNFLVTQVVRDTTYFAAKSFEQFFMKGQSLFNRANYYGGNLRCLLKLAGTPYFPQEPIQALLIEGLGGDMNKIRTYLAQLALQGVFHSLEQLVVGEFTEIYQKGQQKQLEMLLQTYANTYHFNIDYTDKVGHQLEVAPFPYKLAPK